MRIAPSKFPTGLVPHTARVELQGRVLRPSIAMARLAVPSSAFADHRVG